MPEILGKTLQNKNEREKNISEMLKNPRYNEKSLSEFILRLDTLNMLASASILHKISDNRELREYLTYIKKLRSYPAKLLSLVRQNLATSKLDFKKADLAMRRFWHIAKLSEHLDPSLKKSCFRLIAKVDEWFQKYAKNNPTKIKDNVNNYIANINATSNLEKGFHIRIASSKFSKIFKRIKNFTEIKSKDFVVYRYTRGNQSWTLRPILGKSIAIINDHNKEMFVVLPFLDTFDLIEAGKFNEIIEKAKKNHETEKVQKNKLEKFDLPKNQTGSHLRFFPARYDGLISTTLHASSLLTATLNKRYKNLKSRPIIFTNYFKQALYNNIKKDYDKGVRYFYVDIYNHSLRKGLGFKGIPNGKDISAIIKKFPKAKFVFNTIACFGGGLRKGFLDSMKSDPQLKNRVTVFLQTKPNVPNITPGIKNQTAKNSKLLFTYSSFYQLHLTKALLEGKTYGQAVSYADDQSRKIYLNPEAIIKGELYVKRKITKNKEMVS